MSTSAQLDQARRLHNQGKPEQARALVLRALQKFPADPAANQVMAVLLANARQFDQALYYAERALTARPDLAQFHLLKATILSNTPRVLEAIPILEHAASLDPNNPAVWGALAALRQGAHRHADAEAAFRRALALQPGNPDLGSSFAALLLDTGRPEDAVDHLRTVVRHHPQHVRAAETLAFCLNYDARTTPHEVFDAHRRFGALVEASVQGRQMTAWPVDPAPGRRLRVGYVSADFRQHAVSTFFLPVIERHDRAAVEVFLYHTNPVADATTRRLQSSADHWFGTRILTDDELFERLRADRLDVLIELSGLTSQHRLAVLARRPAPIQASYIGYPNTTGLTSIQHLIVDGITDPPGHEAYATEQLARLPHCLLCYDPPAEAPQPVAPPCTRSATQNPSPNADAIAVTFASFNTLGKTTDATLRLWARVLDAVPNSRLLLKAGGLTDPLVHEPLLERARRHGLDPARVVLKGHSPKAEHLAAYAEADICLDPLPFSGATTSCDALYMGVPVVTLEGDRHVARATTSILTTVGRPEWIARTPEDYIRIAAALAADPHGLSAARAALRGQMLASPICNAASYTAALEGLYRSWHAQGSASPQSAYSPT